ncbi:hypothetical protein BH23BAC3_BH23BAC3_02330 [soil metagenome]
MIIHLIYFTTCKNYFSGEKKNIFPFTDTHFIRDDPGVRWDLRGNNQLWNQTNLYLLPEVSHHKS